MEHRKAWLFTPCVPLIRLCSIWHQRHTSVPRAYNAVSTSRVITEIIIQLYSSVLLQRSHIICHKHPFVL